MKALHIIIYSLLCALTASAFSPDFYASTSALATGKWVQISVEESGMHRITAAQLRSWGFANPQKVRVHGYGGARISDVLSAENFIDDLPQVPIISSASGVTFYAVGPRQTMLSGSTLSHEVNPYSKVGYYYITESDSAAVVPAVGGFATDSPAASNVGDVLLVHEEELSSPGSTGRMMVGEDFAYTRSRSFKFNLADAVDKSEVIVNCSFVASAPSASSISLTANGSTLPSSANDKISSVSGSEIYGAQCVTSKKFALDAPGSLAVGVSYNASGAVTAANLDYLSVQFRSRLKAPASGSLEFYASGPLTIPDAGATVWDVTDPVRPAVMERSASGAWQNRFSGTRKYVAFSESATLPSPRWVATVANQNLHAMATPDMVIITPALYASAANALADIHRSDAIEPLKVEVVSLDRVLHEFGSGAFDPGAIRRFLKMLYDRGNLRFALMMGKGTFDNRALTGVGRSLRAPMPLWISAESLTESSSFSTDDYFAFLSDDSGRQPGSDNLSIAVGRIPATTAYEANLAVDKIKTYKSRMPKTDWRNRILMLADDGNNGIHMTQSETFYDNSLAAPGGSSLIHSKVYIDAYAWQNGSYPVARKEFYRQLNDGAMLWVYVGHGSPTALCGDNMVTYLDMSSQFFLRQWPFCYAATCSFLKWDTDITSAAEMLYFTDDGGLIGVISALRPVYITSNGPLTAAFGTEFAGKDEQGRFRTIGEVYQRSKNRLKNDTNRMRFVFMGDPALRLLLPSSSVVLESVNGETVTPDAQVTLRARQQLTLSGSILNPDGSPATGFNGQVSATLYDAEQSVVSKGHGTDGEQVPFEVHGDMLFTTRGTVTDGKFTINVQMPAEIADNFRPATLNLYAMADSAEAVGVCRDIYVFGYDESTPADNVAPVIHSLALNHSTFRSGDRVNATPMLLATVSDNSGINLSSAGVGHQITVTIDGNTSYSDVASCFTPDATPAAGAMSGSIAYTLPALDPGSHSIRLRVWDIAGNHADQTVECVVDPNLTPTLYDVYADANPASTTTSFYVTHDRPDQRISVEVTVYDLLGHPVWTGSTSGRSDMHTSSALRWDLTDNAGRRVGRGIYLYRAVVTEPDGTARSTASRKIAVTAQ